MSFFRLGTTLPHDRGRGGASSSHKSKHPQQAPGFGQTLDAFAALSLRSGGAATAAAERGGDEDGYEEALAALVFYFPLRNDHFTNSFGFHRYDFEDTYDGLGDELDEAGDAFNDDTFGGEETGGKCTNFSNTGGL